MQDNNDFALVEQVDRALAEIDQNLHMMLMLAELSASDSKVDRDYLQQVVERLQKKIDRIADRLEEL